MTTRDFFTGSNVPPIHLKYWVKCHFFGEKMGFLRRSIRVVCMFDSKNSNFSAIAGCPQKRFRNQFSDRLLCMIEKNQFNLRNCSVHVTSQFMIHFRSQKLLPPRSTTPVCDLGSLQPFVILEFRQGQGRHVYLEPMELHYFGSRFATR